MNSEYRGLDGEACYCVTGAMFAEGGTVVSSVGLGAGGSVALPASVAGLRRTSACLSQQC